MGLAQYFQCSGHPVPGMRTICAAEDVSRTISAIGTVSRTVVGVHMSWTVAVVFPVSVVAIYQVSKWVS